MLVAHFLICLLIGCLYIIFCEVCVYTLCLIFGWVVCPFYHGVAGVLCSGYKSFVIYKLWVVCCLPIYFLDFFFFDEQKFKILIVRFFWVYAFYVLSRKTLASKRLRRYPSMCSSRSFLNLVHVYAYGPSQIELCTWCEVGLDSSIPEYLDFPAHLLVLMSKVSWPYIRLLVISLWLSIPSKNVSQVVFPYSKWGPKTRSITSPGSLLEMQHLALRQPYTTPRWFVITLHFEKHWCR